MSDHAVDYDKPFPCRVEGCVGLLKPFTTDYVLPMDDTGSYEKWQCDTCGKVEWVPPPPKYR